MNVPSGYSEIGMIGFTDRGDYASNATYFKNDLVHYSDGLWRCLIDDTSGIKPHECANWTIFVSQPESTAESLIAPIEHDAEASERAYAIGERFILNGAMYKATRAISVGDELVEGTNFESADDISAQLDNKANKTEAFLINETTENTLADADTVPFYDASASSKRKTTWSNIVAKIKASLSKSDVGLGNVPNVSTNDQTPTFAQASSRANIASGEKLSTIFGKIMKVIADLKSVAFTGAYSDLSGTPTIPTKTSQLTNDSGFKTTDNNTTYAAGTGITISGTNNAINVTYGNAANTACQGNDSRLSNSRTPTSHASTGTGYGAGNDSNYGHVKLSDTYTSNVGAAANSIGASQKALYNAYVKLDSKGAISGGNITESNVPNNTWTEVSSVTISSHGKYLFICYVQFQDTSTVGSRVVKLRIGQTDYDLTEIGNYSGWKTVTVPFVREITAYTNIALIVYQASGSTITCRGAITMMRF